MQWRTRAVESHASHHMFWPGSNVITFAPISLATMSHMSTLTVKGKITWKQRAGYWWTLIMSGKVGGGGIADFGVWEIGCPKVASPRLLNSSVIISSNISTTIPVLSVRLYIPQRASTNILMNLFNNYNKNWHFLFPINHVPGTLQMLSHLILDYYESPFYRQNCWGSARWRDLPKVAQLPSNLS